MSAPVFFCTIGIFFGTILLVFGMKYVSAAYQARARLANDAAYRDLAQSSATAQSETATSLSGLQSEIAQIKAGLTSVQKMLREVG
jgi:hypothetical protein